MKQVITYGEILKWKKPQIKKGNSSDDLLDALALVMQKIENGRKGTWSMTEWQGIKPVPGVVEVEVVAFEPNLFIGKDGKSFIPGAYREQTTHKEHLCMLREAYIETDSIRVREFRGDLREGWDTFWCMVEACVAKGWGYDK